MKLMVGTICAIALACAACSDPAAPPAPSVSGATVTDTFSGTLTVGGSNFHPVTVQQVSRFLVTLTSVAPAAALGISVGTLGNGICAPLSSSPAVVPGGTAALSGTALAGSLCVTVFDVGNLVEPVTYTISVAHS
jgi:hypothetical protein